MYPLLKVLSSLPLNPLLFHLFPNVLLLLHSPPLSTEHISTSHNSTNNPSLSNVNEGHTNTSKGAQNNQISDSTSTQLAPAPKQHIPESNPVQSTHHGDSIQSRYKQETCLSCRNRTSVEEALSIPEWRNAMTEEYKALIHNKR